ncbi:MAG: 30S ribosomal protein S12 methylthiotransferase RimO [Bacteroidales bacterium]|nr:30S ribosomal protein S12 methylthiotransferase RimO [Bacteroidales bacterium]
MRIPTLRTITLGCSKNDVDTEHLLACIPSGSYSILPEEDSDTYADILLINTCGFIGDAKEESVNCILEAVAAKNGGKCGKIAVMGCLSQRYASELPGLIPEVDAWFGARTLNPVLKYLGIDADADNSVARLSRPGRSYAYMKISEGCDRRCSYCAIPLIRGAHRSVPVETLVQEARELAAQGVKELLLIAQDSTWYGLDIYGKRALPELIRALSGVDGIEWIRLHYAYPADFPEGLTEEFATNPKVCKYLDIPLQHISDRVLKAMRRKTGSRECHELIARLRKEVPGIVLRTTMMVGHPGEEEEDFQQLLEFLHEARFERLGAFSYSEEEGTWGAEKLQDSVPAEVKQDRLARLMEEQRGISLAFNRSRIGSTERVLVDSYTDGILVCRSQWESPEVDGEILVRPSAGLSPAPEQLIGKFINIKIIAAEEYDLCGEII